MTRSSHRPKAGILVVPAAIALLAACGQPAAPGTAPTPGGSATPTAGATAGTAGATSTGAAPSGAVTVAPVTSGDVTLSAAMGIGFAQYPADPAIRRLPGLVVDYTVRNDGSSPVLAHDMVPSSLGGAALPAQIDPEHAWVFMADRVLRVSKQGFPTTVSFVAAPVTGVREIPAGGTLSGRAVVAVPLRLDVPPREFAAPRAAVPAAPERWQFCIQVEPALSVPLRPWAADPAVLAAPVSPPEPGELICTAEVPLHLP